MSGESTNRGIILANQLSELTEFFTRCRATNN
jgi:hypothetical protein